MYANEAFEESLELLERLISIPRISREEKAAAELMAADMESHGYRPERYGNNLLCTSRYYDAARPCILLLSHIDTVRPVDSWTRDPFSPAVEDGKLYGIGSNDAGASLVSLLYTFYLLDSCPNSLNLLYLASCEEEVSGRGGMRMMSGLLPKISFAIVGEPTGMQPAIAEKGLMVLDFEVRGKSGHAAREEGINAIYRAIDIVSATKGIVFDKVSPLLGKVKFTFTMMKSGTQHNVIPDVCTMTADVRSNELYTNNEILDAVKRNLPEWCTVTPRSTDLNSSGISTDHPAIKRALELGLEPFGSPTLSDQALLTCQSFKMGPGESGRSHSADEFILLDELKAAIPLYTSLLQPL